MSSLQLFNQARKGRVSKMQVLMIQSKIKPEGVADVRAAVDKMLVALEAAQPDGLRYAALIRPDDETIVALRQLDDAAVNPLEDLPEYKEVLEIIGPLRAAPPVVEMWTVTGSYRWFGELELRRRARVAIQRKRTATL